MKKLLLAMLILSISTGFGNAELKKFAYGYTADTMKQGSSEIEVYTDRSFGDVNDPKSSSVKHQMEWEYGLLDNLTTGVYGVFEQKATEKMEYTQTKLRALWAITPKNSLPVDSALYTEATFAHQNDPVTKTIKPTAAEGKFILSKDIDSYNFAASYVAERELIDNAETESKYYIGVMKSIASFTAIGFEYQQQAGVDNDPKQYFIPQVRTIWNDFGINLAFLNPASENTAKEQSWRLILSRML